MIFNNEEILVSVQCLVYNHAPYIRQCLDGFVMQQTSFNYEVIVHDDASTDGSADIILEYAEKYPDIIKPIIQPVNIYSQGISPTREYVMPRCKGKYIAMCEGDDYWTDPYKLQKQVDFMETHPDYSMCFHKVNVILEDGVTEFKVDTDVRVGDWSAKEIYCKWVVSTCSVLFRSFPQQWDNKILYGDIFLFLQCAERGKIRCLDMTAATYRRHRGGMTVDLSINDLMHLYDQYDYMIKRFPEMRDISEHERNRYLNLLKYAPYTCGISKYRFLYILHHPRKFFSRYLFRTLLYAMKDVYNMMICK